MGRPLTAQSRMAGPVQRGRGLGAGQIDPLAFARTAGDATGRPGWRWPCNRRPCGPCTNSPIRPAAGPEAGGEGQARDGLDDRPPGLEAAVGTGVAEAAVGHVDDVGPDFGHGLVAEPQLRQDSRGEVLRDHIRLARSAGAGAPCLPRSCRLRVIPSLPTLWLLNPDPNSIPRRSSLNGGAPRKMSQRPFRTGSSTRITWAPKAARNLVAPAPASTPEKSQIRRPVSAAVDRLESSGRPAPAEICRHGAVLLSRRVRVRARGSRGCPRLMVPHRSPGTGTGRSIQARLPAHGWRAAGERRSRPSRPGQWAACELDVRKPRRILMPATTR